jgi:hypothetical protein
MILGPATQAPSTTPQAATVQTPAVPGAADPGHLLDLQTRVAVLEAQRNVLVERTQADDPALRAQAEHTLLTLDLDLATAKAQLAVLQGTSGTEPPPPPDRGPFGIDQDAITAVFVLTAFAILIPLSVGLTRRFWRGKPARSAPTVTEDKILPRLDRLEQAVDSIAIEMERVSESQRFVAKVLSERPSPSAPPRAPVAADVAPVAEGKPFLALGAGPLEPVRVPERQGVKQSITPH